VFVRFTITGDRATLIAKELSGAGGYEPGTISRQVERDLSEREMQALSRILKQTAVLDLPPVDCMLGADGSQWIVEAADNEGYKYINRWSHNFGPIHDFGIFALKLTGWRYEIY